MKLLTQISRVFVGALFIFSGLVKLNDPMGFAFKLSDYFAPDVLNLPFLQDFTLPMALFIVILEVILGLTLLLGYWRKTTINLLLAMIVFFTFLTFYSAYFNKVTDCGCFGDAIPLTPWQSFYKDLILLFFILILYFNRFRVEPVLTKAINRSILGTALLLCIFMGYFVLNFLPIKDFRAYAKGKSIIEGMKPAEELGLEPPRYATMYTLVHKQNGERVVLDSERYVSEGWWKKEDYEIQKELTTTEKLSDGYEPPVHDFVAELNGEEITDQILEAEWIFLAVAYRIEKTAAAAYPKLNDFALDAAQADIPFIGLTASLPQVIAGPKREWPIRFNFATMDETTLKTIVRANPGVVLLHRGTVVEKWHYKRLPSFEKVQAAYW